MKRRLEELFFQYQKDVYRYLYHLCGDAALAEDLTSEVFLEVVRSIAGFRGEADLKTWLFSIARHRWYHYLRKKKREPQTEALTEFLPSPVSFPDEISYRKLLAERIDLLLEEEPERTRAIVRLRIAGYSFYEIAQRYGISESSARVIDFRTKAKIRKVLQEEGFTYE